MALTFCSFASSSSGNCSLVKSGNTALLVDAGISGRRVLESLKKSGTSPGDVQAVLITHEHYDHVKCLKAFMGKFPKARVYASAGTWESIGALVPENQRAAVKAGEAFAVGDVEAKPFRLSHDAAEPVGYSFCSGGRQVSILTDTGVVTEEIFDAIKGADLLVLEANHDVEMLKMGRYPWLVKLRILGKEGHLSNEDAAGAICRVVASKAKERHILLAHLSKENNFPEMAYQTIKNLLEDHGCCVNKGVHIDIIARDQMSAIYLLA
ncbi:MAG: MBL fold metallo-hydrolase [Clostridiales bacterium]|nr:MBL fold metallo-hydrolase [Clostridiales bacterium]